MSWTAEDELKLHRWVEEKNIGIVYLPKERVWGYRYMDDPTEIMGGFQALEDLKQYLVNLMGWNKSVRVVSEGDFKHELQKIAWDNRLKRLN